MGLAGIRKNDQLNQAFKKQGESLNEANIEHLRKSFETFRGHLEVFARKHKDAIRKDPKFRAKFAEMCNKLGVDPLASNKGFWAKLLGVGDYYYSLGVKIINLTISTREINGGIMDVEEVVSRLKAQNQRAIEAVRRVGRSSESITLDEVSSEDVLKAIQNVSILGSGLRIETLGKRKVLVSVPTEMSQDHTAVLDLASKMQGVGLSPEMISQELGWDVSRAKQACLELAAETFAWWDSVEDKYWFPGFIPGGVKFHM